MTNLIAHKVNTLPSGATIEASALYAQKVGNAFKLYVANSAGTLLLPLTGDFYPSTGGVLSANMTIANPNLQSILNVNHIAAVGNPLVQFQRNGTLEGRVFTLPSNHIHLQRFDSVNGANTTLTVKDGFIDGPSFQAVTPVTMLSDEKTLTTKKYVDDSVAAVVGGSGTGGSAASKPFVMVRSSDTTTNLNLTAWTDAPLLGLGANVDDPAFEISGNRLVCKQAGWIEVSGHMQVESVGQRNVIKIRAAKNGTVVTGVETSTGYIRAAGGHNVTSLNVLDHIEVQVDDEISIQTRKQSLNNTTTTLTQEGAGYILAKYL